MKPFLSEPTERFSLYVFLIIFTDKHSGYIYIYIRTHSDLYSNLQKKNIHISDSDNDY